MKIYFCCVDGFIILYNFIQLMYPTLNIKSKGKVVQMLHAMRTFVGSVGTGEVSVQHPSRLSAMEGTNCACSVGGWVGPTASLDAVEKRKSLVPARY
jgi:hypothetical protein